MIETAEDRKRKLKKIYQGLFLLRGHKSRVRKNESEYVLMPKMDSEKNQQVAVVFIASAGMFSRIFSFFFQFLRLNFKVCNTGKDLA